jgi:light-regulated signal transduction histidine kinase (bacteriophytochrome)
METGEKTGTGMGETAKDGQEIKREFQDLAYMLAHHLKEPVRCIRSGAELLLENENEADPSMTDRASSMVSCAKRILDGALRLDGLATSIAQYADDLSDENEPMDGTELGAIMRALKQKLQPLILQTCATVTIETLPRVECQPARFSRLMEHLLRNAILYCREGVPPLVHISATRTGVEWLFSISDNGLGIEPPYLEHVFEPFRRLHAKKCGGLGMGLAICRKIVVHHGGRIWLESEIGVGSTVFFTLPD